jgi:hypothetical protein
MPKKLSIHQRLIGYAVLASDTELDNMIDTLKAVRDARFTKAVSKRRPKQPKEHAAKSVEAVAA